MSRIAKLIIENVRCFGGRHVLPLSPITILVGENSTGKSTVLAACRLAWDACRSGNPDFNEDPFQLGAFDEIATNSNGRCDYFSLGFAVPFETKDRRAVSRSLPAEIEIQTKFISRGGQAELAEWSMKCGDYSFVSHPTVSGDEGTHSLSMIAPSGRLEGPFNISRFGLDRQYLSILLAIRSDDSIGKPLGEGQSLPIKPKQDDIEILSLIASAAEASFGGQRPYALAPIRTRPLRTYDPVTDKPTPEGGHIPMLLAKLKATGPKAKWDSLRNILRHFGTASGMFPAVDVKRLGGDQPSLPFQIRVGLVDHDFNLVDVGYGVSQVLPILVDTIVNDVRVLLLQQPEVHLHPRAQAALGSFLGVLCHNNRAQPIIVETHSDYLVDRLRMDVREAKSDLQPSDIGILYFEKNGPTASIHPIHLDEHGNLIDAPDGYRAFFMKEEMRLLDV